MSLDDQIARYYCLHGAAQCVVDSSGRVYDKACSECGFTVRHWKESEGIWVCGHCPAPWGYEDVEVLKGEVCRRSKTRGMVTHAVPAPRPGEYENRLAGLAHLGYHLNAMLRDGYWRWPTQVLVAHVVTSCGYEEIAIHANAYGWPVQGEWTESKCRWWSDRARGELRRRLGS